MNIKRPIFSSGPDSVIVKPKAFTGKVNFIRFLFVINNKIYKKNKRHEVIIGLGFFYSME